MNYQGRLELTWTNKHLRLLAHENGSYEWVSPADYRVAEVRLLHGMETVGQVQSLPERAKDNLVIRGDALNTLRSLTALPEFAQEYLGKVKLVYIDPPYNTQQTFLQYDDALEHSVWLTMIRDRLLLIRELLRADGSVWVQLDDNEAHYCRVLMDEVFGRDCFLAHIVWRKRDGPPNDRKIGAIHDHILVYGRSGAESGRATPAEVAFNLMPRTDKANAQYQVWKEPNGPDPRGPFRKIDLTANGKGGRLVESLIFPIRNPYTGEAVLPRQGTCWRHNAGDIAKLAEDNRLYWGVGGTARTPMRKLFTTEAKEGMSAPTIWEDVGLNQHAAAEIEVLFGNKAAYETPKPEHLMHRIIHIGSNSGDIVLDCFAGSGTTAAVAHKMERRWVTVEWKAETVNKFVKPRLTKVVEGVEHGGITDLVNWQGGGGFRVLEVAPSMFEVDGQVVLLADWVTNGVLAEATAAQLGYDYNPSPPFCGRKGRSQLAVIDGLVSPAVVRLITDALEETERVVVCGTAVDPEARDLIRELKPGSTVRKIPQSILHEYRQASRLRQLPLFDARATTIDAPIAEVVKA